MQRKKIQEAMAHVYFQKMTPTGYHEIEQEIKKLQAQRPAKIAQLKAARALGDLSENTEYSTAKRELRHLESRLRYLNKQLQYAEIIKPTDSQTMTNGSTIRLLVSKKPICKSKRFHLTHRLGKRYCIKKLGRRFPFRHHSLSTRLKF